MTAAASLHSLRRLSAVWTLAAVTFFGASNAWAQETKAPPLEYPHTAYSERMETLARQFNAEAKDVAPPIVIMDRDLLALNLALRHIDPFDPPARARLIAELAKAQAGLTVDPERFKIASYEMTTERANTWSPGYGPSADMPGAGFCTVFAEDPDADGPSQVRSIANLEGIFEPLGVRLLNPIPRAVINAYTNYHELGHCVYFVPPPPAGADPDAVNFQRHRQETFGDIFSSLLLARDGVTDFAERYARVRLISSALAGIDDDYLHATWDGLQAAQREIDARGVDGVKKISVREIRDLAKRLMEENTIDIKTMRTAAAFQESQYDEAALKAQVEKDPLLEKSAAYALRLKGLMSDALEQFVDLKGLGPGNLAPLELVQYYKTHEEESPDEAKGPSYKEVIVSLRDELLAAAGGRPDAKSLSLALNTRKEALRKTLDDGDSAQRRQAMRALSLMEYAFRQALILIETPKPAPKPGA